MGPLRCDRTGYRDPVAAQNATGALIELGRICSNLNLFLWSSRQAFGDFMRLLSFTLIWVRLSIRG